MNELLVSLDCDGTLWCGRHPGPVTESAFLALLGSNAVVGITGNWKRCPLHDRAAWGDGYWLLRDGGGWDKKRAEKERVLRWAGDEYPAILRIHVGDEATDRDAAANAGWVYMEPQQFMDHIAGWLNWSS